MCQFKGPIEKFPPNMSSMHNAIRCPECGSTKNNYNTIWSGLISDVVQGKRKGPATHEQAMEILNSE
jgi:hypothetical protein